MTLNRADTVMSEHPRASEWLRQLVQLAGPATVALACRLRYQPRNGLHSAWQMCQNFSAMTGRKNLKGVICQA